MSVLKSIKTGGNLQDSVYFLTEPGIENTAKMQFLIVFFGLAAFVTCSPTGTLLFGDTSTELSENFLNKNYRTDIPSASAAIR